MSTLQDAIRLRLNELIKARIAYKVETDRQMMGFDSAIGELTELLHVEDIATSVAPVTNEAANE